MKALKTPAKKVARRVAPSLTLTADVVKVKQHQIATVTIDMAGLDEVDLALEPKNGMAIDLAKVTKSGPVRLRGLRDGTTTLVATGKKAGAERVRKLMHIAVVGPTVRILAVGYIPG